MEKGDWYKNGNAWGQWIDENIITARGCSLRKSIRAFMALWDKFASYISYAVGYGTRVRFYHDSQCGDMIMH